MALALPTRFQHSHHPSTYIRPSRLQLLTALRACWAPWDACSVAVWPCRQSSSVAAPSQYVFGLHSACLPAAAALPAGEACSSRPSGDGGSPFWKKVPAGGNLPSCRFESASGHVAYGCDPHRVPALCCKLSASCVLATSSYRRSLRCTSSRLVLGGFVGGHLGFLPSLLPSHPVARAPSPHRLLPRTPPRPSPTIPPHPPPCPPALDPPRTPVSRCCSCVSDGL